MQPSDKELLIAIYNDKNEKSFKIFYDKYAKLLLNWANKHTGNKEISADIVQNFWVIFWTKPYAIKTDKENNARKYLIHYFTYRMFDYLRSRAAKPLGDETLLKTLSESNSYSHIIEDIECNEIKSVINGVLKAFPDLTQQIFKEVWDNELSVKETSKHLNVSEKIVRTHYRKVMDTVKLEVQDLLNEPHLKPQKNFLKLMILIGIASH